MYQPEKKPLQLINFMPPFFFYIPLWKVKTFGFFLISGGIEKTSDMKWIKMRAMKCFINPYAFSEITTPSCKWGKAVSLQC